MNEQVEVTITPEKLARYPYFMAWLAEVGRLPEEVANIEIEEEVEVTNPVGDWTMYKSTDNFTAKLIFASGEVLERAGKFSDGTMRYE